MQIPYLQRPSSYWDGVQYPNWLLIFVENLSKFIVHFVSADGLAPEDVKIYA